MALGASEFVRSATTMSRIWPRFAAPSPTPHQHEGVPPLARWPGMEVGAVESRKPVYRRFGHVGAHPGRRSRELRLADAARL